MYITGDFRKKFDLWAEANYEELYIENRIHLKITVGYGEISFYSAPELMLCILIIEFFESLGFCVETVKDTNSKWKSYVNKVSQINTHDNREESMKETILNLQDKYNKGIIVSTVANQ